MRIGILGGGQLGRMLILAGTPLGLQFLTWAEEANCPSGELAPLHLSKFKLNSKAKRFLSQVDVITFEWENVPVEFIQQLEKHCPVYPNSKALKHTQDRLLEKELFSRLKIPTTQYFAIDTLKQLHEGLLHTGYPGVLKTRRLGYDGKGQWLLRSPSDVQKAWRAIGGAALILENYIPFDREVSIIAARSRNGQTVFYPLVENEHKSGILSKSIAPAPKQTHLFKLAKSYITKVFNELNYVGVMAIEFFVDGNRLIANEIAPRVHNSGHWTIEGAITSQFENHLRAICNLPLGSTKLLGKSLMLNLVGTTGKIAPYLKKENAHVHLYGKAPRPGRKLGHITLIK